MRSRRFIGLAMMAAIVLAVAGIAVAHNGSGSGKTEAASATFTATPTDQTKTATCTGADGTYAITKGVYTGTSTGDPRLTGDILIRTKSVINQDNGLGVTNGTVWLKDSAAPAPKVTAAHHGSHGRPHWKAVARLTAVNTNRGKLDGLLTGSAKNTTGRGQTALVANFSAEFNADGSQLQGELGGNDPVAPDNSAVFIGKTCKPKRAADQYTERGHGHHHGDKDHKGGKRH
jgi:hypothetical protein